MGRIAVTGTRRSWARASCARLVEARGRRRGAWPSTSPPPPAALGVRHREVDLTEPASDQRLLDVFREEEVDTVVHAAFFTNPRRDTTYAHELESIGTLNAAGGRGGGGRARTS